MSKRERGVTVGLGRTTTDTSWDGEDGETAAVWGMGSVDDGRVAVAVCGADVVDVDRSAQAVTRASLTSLMKIYQTINKRNG
jgi:hypothetical protein